LALLAAAPASAQVDLARARLYFEEAARLCEGEGGRLWGVSLCGPMVIADAATQTLATNRPVPEAKKPSILGYANAALPWGEERWSTFVWQTIPPDDPRLRGRLMIHELFHRVQPQLGLLLPEPKNDHLETPEGRYWLQLEWRALARALQASGVERRSALADAVAFRDARRARFAEAGENERVLEINEGLAQYTGTVVGAATPAAAVADALEQLRRAPEGASLVRTFAYSSGAAYGVLLDATSPGWARRFRPADDLGRLLRDAVGIEPATDAVAAALAYDGPALEAAERRRDEEHRARIAELRRRFVDGPVLTMPRGKTASFVSSGVTAIPGAGTVFPTYRSTSDWGTLEADLVLISQDQATVIVPAPRSVDGRPLRGEGWTLELAPGWVVRPGARAGDYQIARESRP
jgi:hypothetical protein